MHRTQIYLSAEHIDALDEASRRLHRSRSELIREAIELQYIDRRQREERLKALMESAGAWADREYDGEEFVERLRTGERLRRLYPDDQAPSG